ncbi:MAG TPA: hypothetical protein VGN84_01720 [Solirubrobacterales bacterium]|nr:hypothetical protein [Solirubrobacterales bacterium]
MLTFSNVVAFVALFVALGGSVYAAGKISGAQIKPGSVPGNRIKSKSLTGTQIKPGSLTGTQIKAGSLGATQINQSTLTGVTASSIGSVLYAVATVPVSEALTGSPGTASCPAGTYVIGGGTSLSSESLGEVNDSGPVPTHTGWTATGFAFGPGVTMTVTAICTAVKAIG